jgi:hypothetical protein
MHLGHSLSSVRLLNSRFVKWGTIMYALSNIDFSARLGCVVSEVTPDENNRQEQALDGRQNALADSLPARALEAAIFGAA